MKPNRKHFRRRGANLLEFALVSIVLIPLVFGGISLGMRLGTYIQTTHISRDAAHMYARGVDFSKAANQAVLFSLGESFSLAGRTGRAVVILSQIRYVTDDDCRAIRGACGNRRRHVVTHRLVFGDGSLGASRLATPRDGLTGADGSIGSGNYLNDSSVVLPTLVEDALFTSTGFVLARGEVAYAVETFTPAQETNLFGLSNNGGVYSRAIF
jgi:hypothetical protein